MPDETTEVVEAQAQETPDAPPAPDTTTDAAPTNGAKSAEALAADAAALAAGVPAPKEEALPPHFEAYIKRQQEAQDAALAKQRSDYDRRLTEMEQRYRPLQTEIAKKEHEVRLAKAKDEFVKALGADFAELTPQEQAVRIAFANQETLLPANPLIQRMIERDRQAEGERSEALFRDKIRVNLEKTLPGVEELPEDVIMAGASFVHDLSSRQPDIPLDDAARMTAEYVTEIMKKRPSSGVQTKPTAVAPPISAAPPTRHVTDGDDVAYQAYLRDEDARKAGPRNP
jgi:hypothetical protein